MDDNQNNMEGGKPRLKLEVSKKMKLMQLQDDAAQKYIGICKKHEKNESERIQDNSSRIELMDENDESRFEFTEDMEDHEFERINHNLEISDLFNENSDNFEQCCSNYDSDSSADSDVDNDAEFSRDTSNHDSSFLQFHNMLMFPQSGLQVNDVIEMLMGYFTQFGLTEEARLKLIDIIKILAGPLFKDLNISNYMLNKDMNAPPETIVFHYYCQECEKVIVHSSVKSKIKGQNKVCQQCLSVNKINLSNNKYFLTVNLEYQLNLLLKDEEIRNYLINVAKGITKVKETTAITDIQDSKLYRNTKDQFPNTITYNLSTDGAPVSSGKSGTRSFWPLSIIINDLPPEIRFKYILLVGIMVVTNEPQPHLMNLFIDKFKEEAIHLHTAGLTLELANDCKITLTFTPFCVIADSPAKALLQCRMKYNGYCSCSYCYQFGFYCGIVKFPFIGSDCEQRTHSSHMEDVEKMESLGKTVRGVKGRSSFCNFPNIDMVYSFNLDFMHNGILGVAEQIWLLIKAKISASERRSLDNLLIRIQPPRELHRKPEKLTKISCWKATNWKAWLLHYSVPLLMTIESLPIDLLHHYALFVNAMFILSKTYISQNDLLQCRLDLLKFVAHVEIHYGISAMTFNVHLLLHATENVINTGPAWATSAFPYESNIFVLKSSANGPKNADQQMAKNRCKD
ncbi:uncharacterized protein LOC122500736 [Leptopilina heterotoma]|uniref:uncharacterized protein LOC122500736 n=1 Tax=Leptopilina heterotoma TaxID=63436 RepID=UPI001CA9C40F|nr:uncharacterized protein LOC122500736 [Leptopilina heterotoma]